MEYQFVTCPLNPSHRLLKLKLQHHILRCRRSYNGPPVKPCPFNATHMVLEEEYSKHVITCPDVRLIEGHKYKDNVDGHGNIPSGRYHFAIQQEEDWSSDAVPQDESNECFQINSNDDSDYNDCSQTADNGSDDDGSSTSDLDDYFLNDSGHEEPLQGYFYEKRKQEKERLANSAAKMSPQKVEQHVEQSETISSKDNEGLEKDIARMQIGNASPHNSDFGRRKLLRLLSTLK